MNSLLDVDHLEAFAAGAFGYRFEIALIIAAEYGLHGSAGFVTLEFAVLLLLYITVKIFHKKIVDLKNTIEKQRLQV